MSSANTIRHPAPAPAPAPVVIARQHGPAGWLIYADGTYLGQITRQDDDGLCPGAWSYTTAAADPADAHHEDDFGPQDTLDDVVRALIEYYTRAPL